MEAIKPKFDKYDRYGAYHWALIDSSKRFKSWDFSLALLERYEQVLKQIPKGAQFGVEIGCGDGALTYLLRKHSVPAMLGCDVDPKGIALAKEKTHNLYSEDSLRFECKKFEDCRLQPGTVDVIVLADVLEHLQDPEALLRHIKTVCKAGGRVIITTPKKKPSGAWDPCHLCEYSEETLAKMLNKFFPNTVIRSCIPFPVSKIYGYNLFGRHLLNALSMVGLNIFKFNLPKLRKEMLVSVSTV